MNIKIDIINNVTVLALNGELNVDESNVLRQACLKALQQGALKVMIDFEKVTFLGSAGLAVLIEIMQQLKKANGKLTCCNVNKDIRGLFEITKTYKLITVYESRGMALKNM
jgi:anti-anti-sigma factor